MLLHGGRHPGGRWASAASAHAPIFPCAPSASWARRHPWPSVALAWASVALGPAGAGRAWKSGRMRRRRASPPASWMASVMQKHHGSSCRIIIVACGPRPADPPNTAHASSLPPMPAGVALQRWHWLLRAHAARTRAWRQRGCPARQDRHGAAGLQHPGIPLVHRPDHRRRGGHRLARLHAALWLGVVAGAAAEALPLHVLVAWWPSSVLAKCSSGS